MAPPSGTQAPSRNSGVDVGFTKEAHVVRLVFAPGQVASGTLAGDDGGATAVGSVGVEVGANVPVGGSNKQITLQPVSAALISLNAAAVKSSQSSTN